MKNKSGSFVCSAIPFFPAQNDTEHTITQVRWQHLCPLAAKWAVHRVPWAHWRESWVLPDWRGKKQNKKQNHYKKQKGWKQGHPTLCIDSWWPKENLGQALRLTGAALGTFWLITGATLWPPVGWITGLLGLLNNSNSLCQNLASLVSQVVNFVDLLGQRHRLAPGKLYTTAMEKFAMTIRETTHP